MTTQFHPTILKRLLRSLMNFKRLASESFAVLAAFALMFGLGLQAGAQTATIHFFQSNQTIAGLGGGVTNRVPQQLPPMDSTMADTMFCNGSGQLGLSLLRLNVDPGGENPVPYLHVAPYNDGFGWAAEMTDAQEAESCGAQVFATPFAAYCLQDSNPDDCMTSNGSLFGGSLITSDYADYATYLQSYVDYLSENDVTLSAISLQNEPNGHATSGGYTTWTPSEFENWLAGDGQMITGARIMFPEDSTFDASMADPALENSSASKYVGVLGGHCYGPGQSAAAALDTNAAALGIPEWMSECSTHTDNLYDNTQTWQWAMDMATSIAMWMNGGYNAYSNWLIQDGGVQTNLTTSEDFGFMSSAANSITVSDGTTQLCRTYLPATTNKTWTEYTCTGTVNSSGELEVILYGGNIGADTATVPNWTVFDSASLTVNGGSNLLANSSWGSGDLTGWVTGGGSNGDCATWSPNSAWVATSGDGMSPHGTNYLMGISNSSANNCRVTQEVTGLTSGESFTLTVYAATDVSSSSTIEPKGYAMAQYSKFVRPGYQNVNATYTPQTGVNVTAYEGGGKYVIVAVNNNSSAVDQTFDFYGETISSAGFTVTESYDAGSNHPNDTLCESGEITCLASGGTVYPTGADPSSFSYSLQPYSITTFTGTGTSGSSNLLLNQTWNTGDLIGWIPYCSTGPTSSVYVAHDGGGTGSYKGDLTFSNTSYSYNCRVSQEVTGQTNGDSFTLTVYAKATTANGNSIVVWDGSGTQLCSVTIPASVSTWTPYTCSGTVDSTGKLNVYLNGGNNSPRNTSQFDDAWLSVN